MAINVNLIYVAVLKVIQKELGSGYLDPDQFNVFANMANVELFNKYSDIYQDTQRVTDKILPFITKLGLVIDTAGKMSYPSDYVTKVATRAFDPDELAAAIAANSSTNPIDYNKIKQIKVKTIDNNKLGDRLDSAVLQPNKYHPINTFYSGYLQWYPIDLGSGFLEYLKQPIEVVWGWLPDSNGLEVYNPVTSTDFQWNWLLRNELIVRICKYFGVSVREEDLVKYSEELGSEQA